MILGVAFVWFTTHFGGGFASGAQIYSYYVRYGVWSLFMPFLAMAYNGVFFAYCLYFARKHQVYDYRSYNDAFYGKYAPVFSNLFEVLYLCVMCVAPAVAFATGGATLSTLTGLPYLLCTLLIGVFIFVVAIFATDLVRKVASYYYRSSGSVCAEYHRRSRENRGDDLGDDGKSYAVWKSVVCGFLIWNLSAGKCSRVRTACKII